MISRVLAGVVWLAVFVTGAHWGRLLLAPSPAAVADRASGLPVEPPGVGPDAWARLFGVDPVPVAAAPMAEPATPMRLVGVVAPRDGGRDGLALIAVGDRPARTYRVGAAVDGDLFLHAVRATSVELAPRDGAAAGLRTLALAAVPGTPSFAVPAFPAPVAAARAQEPTGVSPIVPPHPEMPTPSVADSRTPELHRAVAERAADASPREAETLSPRSRP
jgi:general secretion pathway protein C